MSMSQEEYDHSNGVRLALQAHPEWLASTICAIQAGVQGALQVSNEDKVEWEVVAMNSMHARVFKDNKLWLADKIDALKPRSAMRWDYILKKLRGE